MFNKNTLRQLLIITIFLTGITFFALLFKSKNSETAKSPIIPTATLTPSVTLAIWRETAQVGRVVDGDTIELTDKRKVRYIGIDTPESVDPRKPVQCFARQASKVNRELVEGQTVELEGDVSDTDKYGRLLRFVYIDDIFVNDFLVRQGFARIDTVPPDVKFARQFLQAEREARDSNRGLWKECPVSR